MIGNKPDRQGLTDIAGNVWEWMGHSYVGKYDPCVDVGLQQATKYGSLRGCSWVTIPGFARCSFRRAYHPDGWNDSIGFRVVLSLAN